jgi:twitching motility protein PilT
MRQDPDVLLIGEMREAETVDVAIKAAETGHLVLSSLHTSDSASSLARLIGFFPSEQETGIRKRLSDCIVAIIALRLLPSKGGIGRIPAVEVLRVTRTIQECIRDATKTDDIQHYLEQGAELYEMQTFDRHLRTLVREDKVDLEAAKLFANNPEDLVRSIMLE